MGDPSFLRYVPPSIANIPIDWSRVPEASKEHILLWAYDWEKKVKRPLPTTIAELAKWFDHSKFFGYLNSKLCTLIMDISEFGLKEAQPKHGGFQAGPRFYMKQLKCVWFLLFTPGERNCIVGYSHDIKDIRYDEDIGDDEDKNGSEDIQDRQEEDKGDEDVKAVKQEMEDETDEDEEDELEQRQAAEETALARQFDVTLERDVSRGMAPLVTITDKLGGWSASMVEDDLKFAQYAEAIMTLPRSHPAYAALMSSAFSQFQK